MKKILLMIVALLILGAVNVFGLTQITNCDGLQNMNNDLAGDYELANDIDCSGTTGWNGGAGFEPIGDNPNYFTGVFDGKGYNITGLYINRQSTSYIGLFGWARNGAIIKNVGLIDANIKGNSYVGGLAGRYYDTGTMSHCFVTGSVYGSSTVGCLIGQCYNSNVIDSYATCNINSPSATYVGGLVAATTNSQIINCYATGNVNGGWSCIGGLVGSNVNSIINHSYATGDVSGNHAFGDNVGLLAGAVGTGGIISDSYYYSGATCTNSGISGTCNTDGTGKTPESYFYNSINSPMDEWDFNNTWLEQVNNYPILREVISPNTSPTYTTFTSTETTNFSEGDVTNVTSLTLAIDNKGKIVFPLGHSINSEGADYDTNVKIEDAMIYVNSAALDSSFNDSATLTFEGVNCNAPYVYYSTTASTRGAILAEDTLCPSSICTNIECTGSTLTVDVAHFSGYAVNGTANLTIDADDPKYVGELVTFTAEYMNAIGFITDATCNISFSDGSHIMDNQTDYYNYSRTFASAQIVEYNVTCNATGENTVFANDTAVIQAIDIPEFSTITLGLGLIAVLAGLFIIRKRRF